MSSPPFDLRHEHGAFDLVGDVHGCFDELSALLRLLGYTIDRSGDSFAVVPPAGRRAVFIGDYVDRGPDTPSVLRLVMAMAAAGHAICLPGNHDDKLVRALRGRNVSASRGLQVSLSQLADEPPEFKAQVIAFIEALPVYVMLDEGRLVAAHGGLKEAYHGQMSEVVRAFALYGDATGETDAAGFPVRRDWAAEYRGQALVVYGHTPVATAEWVNNTINIDTGCVFGGALTALRYPERDLLAVRPPFTYAHTNRAFLPDDQRPPDRLVWQGE
jgi:protein phosphatase